MTPAEYIDFDAVTQDDNTEGATEDTHVNNDTPTVEEITPIPEEVPVQSEQGTQKKRKYFCTIS